MKVESNGTKHLTLMYVHTCPQAHTFIGAHTHTDIKNIFKMENKNEKELR